MTDRIHGGVFAGEHLSSNIDFWTLYTAHALNITGGDVNEANPNSADNLDAVIQFIGQRAQTVMVSVAVSGSVDLEVAPTNFGTQMEVNAVYYTLKFATEHTGAWNDTVSAVNNLEESLDSFPLPVTADFSAQTAADTNLMITSGTTTKNTTVVRALTL